MKLSTSARLQRLRVRKKEVIKKSRLVIKPASGYIHQRVYTEDRRLDERLSTVDRNVVLAAECYDLVGAPHGYTSHHLDVMAGPVLE